MYFISNADGRCAAGRLQHNGYADFHYRIHGIRVTRRYIRIGTDQGARQCPDAVFHFLLVVESEHHACQPLYQHTEEESDSDIFFTILMQVLHWLKINVFKVVVLLGTFALRSEDIRKPSGELPAPLVVKSMKEEYPAKGTPMKFTRSLPAKDLARQDEGEENFGSTPIARTLVRLSMTMSNNISKVMPEGMKSWLDTRFRKDEAILADGAAFDLVRASVNLVLAGLLIALGTSLKLPLSTTYVTFMVAMGTSLADRAWGRDSAVYSVSQVYLV